MLESLSDQIVRVSILAVPLLLGLTCHELAHGLVALSLGDPTAKLAGRLTMNPLKHLDPMGAIAFILANIGWAKPVPVNPMYFKHPMRDMMLVSLAGPGANFLLALLSAGLFHLLLPVAIARPEMIAVLQPLVLICQAGVIVNLMLAFFNLLPVPPLDGSNILAWFLPDPLAYKFLALGRYGFMLLLGLLIVSQLLGVSLLGSLIFPPVGFVSALLGVPL
ncbi:MAG: site-2 protease family protein [Deltaproteobacteria bacterium HGW-Deltaproteobacteria-8]|jgi:Zn-dependent protease|nr:MAG: site-2 protease family protein [Deltaproteobacteria bacterium HGW-Deltaproteobacteria-8]